MGFAIPSNEQGWMVGGVAPEYTISDVFFLSEYAIEGGYKKGDLKKGLYSTSDINIPAAFMHELGHNLGLEDVFNKGNNYKSVMNYDWHSRMGYTYTKEEWDSVDLTYGISYTEYSDEDVYYTNFRDWTPDI